MTAVRLLPLLLLAAACAPSAPGETESAASSAGASSTPAAAEDGGGTMPAYRGAVRTVGERQALEAFLFAQPDGAPFRLDLRLHDPAEPVADEDGDLIVDLGYPYEEEAPADPRERRAAAAAVPSGSQAGIELVVVPGGDRAAMSMQRGRNGALRGTFVVDTVSGPRQGIVSFAVRPVDVRRR